MKIQTGRGTIPLVTLVGIWSISALNALPGLAVSPILGKLAVVFPHSTQLDIQMLSSLPSLLIIPFIILAGKLNERVGTVALLQSGLAIFALSGVLYLLSDKMWQLIAVSALLGVGSGMIVPLSTGLVSKLFTGVHRTKQFGLSSAITNATLVLATALAGYLAEIDWHLPFAVYLLPLVSIALSFYLKRSMAGMEPEIAAPKVVAKPAETPVAGKYGIEVGKLVHVMAFYGLATYLVVIINFNLPFLMEEYHFGSGDSGLMISLFLLAIMAPGFVLNQLVGRWRKKTKFYSMLGIAVGMGLIVVSRTEWLIGLGCVLAGFGYGIIQPVAYDKTTRTAVPRKVTLALAFVMSMNYLAILLCPFIVDFFQSMLAVKSQQFAFIFNMCIAVAAAVWAYLKQDSFLFDDKL